MFARRCRFRRERNDALTCIQTERLRFLDAMNYILPRFSYAKYLSAYGVEECKGVFPYEWPDGLDKLDYSSFPPREAFYSTLRQKHISDDDYTLDSRAWSTHGMKTVKDPLIWYNNLDVVPFLKALQAQCAVYEARGIRHAQTCHKPAGLVHAVDVFRCRGPIHLSRGFAG